MDHGKNSQLLPQSSLACHPKPDAVRVTQAMFSWSACILLHHSLCSSCCVHGIELCTWHSSNTIGAFKLKAGLVDLSRLQSRKSR